MNKAIYTTPGTFTWIAEATSVTVECWDGGSGSASVRLGGGSSAVTSANCANDAIGNVAGGISPSGGDGGNINGFVGVVSRGGECGGVIGYTVLDEHTGYSMIPVMDVSALATNSTIGGYVNLLFIKSLNLASVPVTLTGIDYLGNVVNRTVDTDYGANQTGKFEFLNVLPSNATGYTLSSALPNHLIDGVDSIIDTVIDANYTPGIVGTNTFTGIIIGNAGTTRASLNYKFYCSSVINAYNSACQFVSSYHGGPIISVSPLAADQWFLLNPSGPGGTASWDNLKWFVVNSIASDNLSLSATITDMANNVQTVTIDYHQYYLAGTAINDITVWISGTPSEIGLSPLQPVGIILPVAGASLSPSPIYFGQSTTLDGSSSTDADGIVVRWKWYVNSSASEANLLADVVTSTTAVSYSTVKAITGANGTFNIYLVVQDNLGAWSTNTATVPLTLGNTIPVAGASLSPSPIYFGQSTTLNGSTSTDADGTVVRWKWYVNSSASEVNLLADVVTSTTAVSYATVKAITGVNGTFNIYLVVQDNDGAWSVNVATVPLTLGNTIPVAGASLAPSPIYWSQSTTLNGSTSTDVDGTVVRWKWYVNSSASEANLLANVVTSTTTVSYATVKAITGANGTFNIYLVVQDNLGAWSTNTATVPLTLSNTIPVAIISGGPNLGTLTFGQTVTFNGSTSYDSDGSVVRWKWYLTSTGSEINLLANVVSNTALVSYATIRSISGGIGTFNVILKVQDNEGAWSVDSNVCQITLVNTPPTAVAGGPYGPLYNNQNMVFNGSGSFDPDGAIVSYKWYMTTMDHPTDTHLLAIGVQPTVTFAQWLAAGGTFGENIIYLIVQDSNGVWSTSSEARATYTSRPPIANANGTYGPVSMGGAVTLNSTGSSAPNGSIITYKWYLNSVDNPTDLNLLATGASPILSYNTLRTEFGGFIGTRTLLLIVQDNYGFWSPASSTTVTLNAPHASYKFVKSQQTGLYNMTISGITDLNHYAVAGWFKPSVAGNTPTLFSMGDFNTGQKDIVGLHTVGANPDRLYFQTVNGTGTYTLNTTGVNFGLNDGPLTTNPIHASPGWHHFYMEVRGRRVDLFNPSPSGRWIVVIPDGQWAYRGAWGTTVVPETDPPFPGDATHNYDYTSLGIDLLNLLQSSSGWFADVAVWGFPNINNSANTVYAPADWPAGLRVNYGELVAGVCPLTVQMAAGARLLAFWPLIENYEDYKNHYDLTCGV